MLITTSPQVWFRWRVRLLGCGAARMEDRPTPLDARMDAREPLLGGEAGEIAFVLLHPVAEPFPQGAALLFRKGRPVDQNNHDFTSARTSAACLDTSTSR